MTDDLDIQRILKDRLDPVQTRGSIPAEVVRNAKKRRVLFTSLISGGLVLILGGTGVLGASLLRRENTIPPVTPVETASPSPEANRCEPEPERSYGKTIPAEWLRDLFVKGGAPGGHPVSPEDVIDTGTALEIRIPAYDEGPTLYATLLPHPFPENEDWTAPEEEVGRQGDFTLYFKSGDFAWESYGARSDEWQLSLLAYPGFGNERVEWPKGVQDWLEGAIENLEQAPPNCDSRQSSKSTADRYPLIAQDDNTNVFGPVEGQLWGWCPTSAEALSTTDLRDAENAVLLATDQITGSGLNTDDAYTDVTLASEDPGPPDFARMISRDCPSLLVERTALVTLRLPNVDSASMSAETYFVSKEPRG